jgi:transposase
MPSSSRPPSGQGRSRLPAAAHDVVPAAITFAALGLDISQAEVVACLLLPDGRELVPRWTIPNSLPGAENLAERVQALATAQGIQEVRIGLEATGLYWWHLAGFLTETPLLAEVEHRLYVFNPALVQGLKRVYADAGKTDRLDAFFIAERLRVGRLPMPFQPDLVYAPLQRLTRFRMHLAQALAREKNYCLALLFLPFSAFSQEAPFDDLFSPTSLGILETFTTEDLAQTSLEDLATFVQQHGRGRFADPHQVAITLQQAARHSYRLPPGLDEPLKLILTTTLATIRTLQGQLRAVDRTIAQDVAALPAARRTLDSVPGLGPVWTAGLLAEVGDIFRFGNEAAVAKFAGLVWKPRESGEFQAEDTVLAKTGNPFLRYYLIEAANSVRQHCPEYRDYYNTKLAQSPKHAHKRALVLTARKLVRLVDALLRAGTVYHLPETRQDQKEERTAPHGARPQRHRRTPLAPSAC